MVYEVVDNSIDERWRILRHVTVTLNGDGSCTVTDNGRGIPVDNPPRGRRLRRRGHHDPLHAGGKFDQNSYKSPAGCTASASPW